MHKVRKKLGTLTDEKNVYKLFETAGKTMLMSMGGASGVIFGSLYLAGAQDAEPSEVLTGADIAAMERRSLEAIQAKGGAQVGDKTMVDALVPAVEKMDAAVAAGASLLDVLKAAEQGAMEGMEELSLCDPTGLTLSFLKYI